MRISLLIVGLLLIGGVIWGITSFEGDLAATYSFTSNSTHLAAINQSASLNALMDDIRLKLENRTINNIIDAFDMGLTITFDSMKASFNALNIGITVINQFSLSLNLPVWVIPTAIVILITLFVFTVVRFWKGGGEI
jgi:hypothetical protein